METILDDGNEDTPLAFFEACEEAQHQVMQLMRSIFVAVLSKRESCVQTGTGPLVSAVSSVLLGPALPLNLSE